MPSKIILVLFFILSPANQSCNAEPADADIHQLWIDCRLKDLVAFNVFKSAMQGYYKIDKIRKKNIITIIDFSKPSTYKRFFVIDLENKRLLYNCLTAHGKNTGENYAKSFSNQKESLKSSPGFYLTAETYSGIHGYSLKLDGLEKNINDNAREREIVIHGAEYVSVDFIEKYGRLGRSWGCPALPVDISIEIIDLISDGSCMFIYADDKDYLENSVYINNK